jgi:hypothetical protein
MRLRCVSLVFAAGLITLSACGSRQSPEERHDAANTPAGKLGQAAHRATVEANKAGQAIGRELSQAARNAREGWKEDARKQRDKK